MLVEQSSLTLSLTQIIYQIQQNLLTQDQSQLLNLLKQLYTKILVEKAISISLNEFNFIFQFIENYTQYSYDVLETILLIIYGLTFSSTIEEFETFLQTSQLLIQLNGLFYNCSEFSLDFVDLLLLILENIARKSNACLNNLIQNNFLIVVKWMLETIEIQNNEKCVISLLGFLSVFVEQNFNKEYKDLQIILLNINKLCKIFLKINYFSIEQLLNDSDNLEKYEIKINLITKLLNVVKYYTDKLQQQANIYEYKYVWRVILLINFSDCQLIIFQKITAYILSTQTQSNEFSIKYIVKENQQILEQLLNSLNKQQKPSGDVEKFRMHNANTFRNIYQHLDQTSLKFYEQNLTDLIEIEQSCKVLSILLECLYILLQKFPDLKYLSLIEIKLKFCYENSCWQSLKYLLLSIALINEQDQMKSLKESKIGYYIELLSQSGSKQIQVLACKLLEQI
ncbi:unnamed protein product [Paramecium pentaurelia]|uniref:Uncharacterized protein n=1 Tax=Paramecium pentaurelia TaxID=43138 RepID=A0A8S1S3N3_9CILI|nr:unnamed protein product [Paramecium pentaurelia]